MKLSEVRFKGHVDLPSVPGGSRTGVQATTLNIVSIDLLEPACTTVQVVTREATVVVPWSHCDFARLKIDVNGKAEPKK